MSAGIIAETNDSKFVCVIQRKYFGPDKFFLLLQHIDNENINDLLKQFFRNNIRYDFLNPNDRNHKLWNRMTWPQKNISFELNDTLIKSIMNKLMDEGEPIIENYINKFYDFGYILGFPKGSVEEKDKRNVPANLSKTHKELLYNFNCAIREWNEETEIPINKSLNRDFRPKKINYRRNTFNYFIYNTPIEYQPLVKQNIEIVGTILLSADDLYGLKSVSNNYTKEYLSQIYIPNRNIIIKKDEKINEELNKIYPGDRNFIKISDYDLIQRFGKDDIVEIITSELKDYIPSQSVSSKYPGKIKSKPRKHKKSTKKRRPRKSNKQKKPKKSKKKKS